MSDTYWSDCFDLDGDEDDRPGKIIGEGESVDGGETALKIVKEDDFATRFVQPEFSDAWWFLARMDGCVEFGQLDGGKRNGSEHVCNLTQLIALLSRVQAHMSIRSDSYGEPGEPPA